MKSVLISIQPKWCEMIASGKKTVEVRKTRPKLETPFKVYIYMTKNFSRGINSSFYYYKSGKVIGEFVCDYIGYVRNYGDMVDSYDCIASCLSANEIIEYAKDKNGNFVYTYGWHISNLVIYDKPRELKEYSVPKEYKTSTQNKQRIYKAGLKAPQSWCYVESEVEGE